MQEVNITNGEHLHQMLNRLRRRIEKHQDDILIIIVLGLCYYGANIA